MEELRGAYRTAGIENLYGVGAGVGIGVGAVSNGGKSDVVFVRAEQISIEQEKSSNSLHNLKTSLGDNTETNGGNSIHTARESTSRIVTSSMATTTSGTNGVTTTSQGGTTSSSTGTTSSNGKGVTTSSSGPTSGPTTSSGDTSSGSSSGRSTSSSSGGSSSFSSSSQGASSGSSEFSSSSSLSSSGSASSLSSASPSSSSASASASTSSSASSSSASSSSKAHSSSLASKTSVKSSSSSSSSKHSSSHITSSSSSESHSSEVSSSQESSSSEASSSSSHEQASSTTHHESSESNSSSASRKKSDHSASYSITSSASYPSSSETGYGGSSSFVPYSTTLSLNSDKTIVTMISSPTSAVESQSSDGTKNGKLIGGVVGSIGGCIVIFGVALVFYFLKKRKRSNLTNQSPDLVTNAVPGSNNEKYEFTKLFGRKSDPMQRDLELQTERNGMSGGGIRRESDYNSSDDDEDFTYRGVINNPSVGYKSTTTSGKTSTGQTSRHTRYSSLTNALPRRLEEEKDDEVNEYTPQSHNRVESSDTGDLDPDIYDQVPEGISPNEIVNEVNQDSISNNSRSRFTEEFS